MWRNWLLGFIGLWLIIIGFSGLSSSVQRVLVIITGLFITVFCFWKAIEERVENYKPNQGPK